MTLAIKMSTLITISNFHTQQTLKWNIYQKPITSCGEKKDTLIAILGRNCFIHLSDSDLVISGYFLHWHVEFDLPMYSFQGSLSSEW